MAAGWGRTETSVNIPMHYISDFSLNMTKATYRRLHLDFQIQKLRAHDGGRSRKLKDDKCDLKHKEESAKRK